MAFRPFVGANLGQLFQVSAGKEDPIAASGHHEYSSLRALHLV